MFIRKIIYKYFTITIESESVTPFTPTVLIFSLKQRMILLVM